MSVCVRLPALLAHRIAGVSTVDVPAHTVQDALRTLAVRYPELRNLVLGPSGEINPMVVVFLNDEQLSPGQLTSSVGDDDEIEIIPAIEGGSLEDATPSLIDGRAHPLRTDDLDLQPGAKQQRAVLVDRDPVQQPVQQRIHLRSDKTIV